MLAPHPMFEVMRKNMKLVFLSFFLVVCFFNLDYEMWSVCICVIFGCVYPFIDIETDSLSIIMKMMCRFWTY